MGKSILQKISGKSTIKASRKTRNIIVFVFAILTSVFLTKLFLRLRQYHVDIISEFSNDEDLLLDLAVFQINYTKDITLYYLIGISTVVLGYLVTVFLITEITFLFTKFCRKKIFQNSYDNYKEIDKNSVKYRFIVIMLFFFIYVIYLINYLTGDFLVFASSGDMFLSKEILNSFLLFGFIILSADIIIIYYFLKKTDLKKKKKKKLEKRIVNYNILTGMFYSFLFIIVLNIFLPSFLNLYNDAIEFVYSNLYAQFTDFIEPAKQSGFGLNYETVNLFEMELNKLIEYKFNANQLVIEFSSLMLYIVTIAYGLIILLPKFLSIGLRRAIIVIVALILGTIVSEILTKFLYINENVGNKPLIYIFIFLIFALAINELTDLFKDIALKKRITGSKK